MIDKLILKNFQAHKHTEIEFGPGCNCLVGESDEGKTSIIRALYWASQNKPSGGDFISDFSKKGECSSTIVVDGNEVTRFKNKTKNEYIVNGQAFKALGKGGVPDEVKNILQLDELNFQNQMDSPFLLSSSSGEVARYLNDIVNLNVIDESLKKVNAKTNACNRDIENKEAEIESNTIELKDYAWLKQAEKELLQLENDDKVHKNAQQENKVLADLLNDADDLSEDLKKYQDNDTEEKEIRLLLEEYKCYKTGLDIFNDFSSDLSGIKAILVKLDALPFNKKEIADIIALEGLIDVYQTESDLLNEWDYLLNDIEAFEKKKEVCIESIQTLEIEFKRDFPSECNADTCPLMEI